MINLSSPTYYEDTSILRATQQWQKESNAEKQLSQNYQVFLEQVKREMGDLYAEYGVDGLLDYALLQRRLTPAQLSQYRSIIQNVIRENQDIEDESLLLAMQQQLENKDLTVIDSKIELLEVYLLVMVHKNIKTVSESLSQTYQNSYSYALYDLHRKIGQVMPFEVFTDKELRDLIRSDWFGDTFEDAIKFNRHGLLRSLKKSIVTGIRRNESYQKLLKGLTDLVSGGKGYKGIRNILRGETTRVISEATTKSYEQCGIDSYQIIATLDNRTSGICRKIDMKVFPLSEKEIGKNFPPLHHLCRSTVAPFIPEDDLSKVPRRARDPKTNKNYTVPGDMTYKEWNQKYNK